MTDVLALAEDALVSNINCERCCDVLVFVCSPGLSRGNWPELHSKPASLWLKASASASAASLYPPFLCCVHQHKHLETSSRLQIQQHWWTESQEIQIQDFSKTKINTAKISSCYDCYYWCLFPVWKILFWLKFWRLSQVYYWDWEKKCCHLELAQTRLF